LHAFTTATIALLPNNVEEEMEELLYDNTASSPSTTSVVSTAFVLGDILAYSNTNIHTEVIASSNANEIAAEHNDNQLRTAAVALHSAGHMKSSTEARQTLAKY
jgi:hypothetical protein